MGSGAVGVGGGYTGGVGKRYRRGYGISGRRDSRARTRKRQARAPAVVYTLHGNSVILKIIKPY